MSLSAWLTESAGGDFAGIQSMRNATQMNITIASYTAWPTSVCATSPYIYIEPFAFSYNFNGVDYVNPAYCGFPRSNSILRIFTSVLTLLILFAFFFETPFSALGRTLQMCMACLFFTSFVLDANAVTTGYELCKSNFGDTYLHDDLVALNITLTCKLEDYAAVTVISFFLAVMLLLLQAAWSNCTDMYASVPKSSAAANHA